VGGGKGGGGGGGGGGEKKKKGGGGGGGEGITYLHGKGLGVTLFNAQLFEAGDLDGAKALGLGDEATEEDVV